MKLELPELEFFPKDNRETIRKERAELSDDEWNAKVRFYTSINESFKGKAQSAVATFDLGFIHGVEYSIKYLQAIMDTTKAEAAKRVSKEDVASMVVPSEGQ